MTPSSPNIQPSLNSSHLLCGRSEIRFSQEGICFWHYFGSAVYFANRIFLAGISLQATSVERYTQRKAARQSFSTRWDRKKYWYCVLGRDNRRRRDGSVSCDTKEINIHSAARLFSRYSECNIVILLSSVVVMEHRRGFHKEARYEFAAHQGPAH